MAVSPNESAPTFLSSEERSFFGVKCALAAGSLAQSSRSTTPNVPCRQCFIVLAKLQPHLPSNHATPQLSFGVELWHLTLVWCWNGANKTARKRAVLRESVMLTTRTCLSLLFPESSLSFVNKQTRMLLTCVHSSRSEALLGDASVYRGGFWLQTTIWVSS